MSRKEEIKAELEVMRQKWTQRTDELKKIEADEDFIDRVRRFSPYKFKCFVNYDGSGLSEDRSEITPDDIRRAKVRTGIPEVSHYGGMGGDSSEVFLKDDADWERVNKLFGALRVFFDIQASGTNPKDLDKPEVEVRRVAAVEKLLGMLKP